MSSSSATARMAGSDTQPSCFCTSHRIGTTADAAVGGVLGDPPLGLLYVSGEKAKGWLLLGETADTHLAKSTRAILPSRNV